MTKITAALAFLILNFYTYNYLATEEEHPPRRSFAEFPLHVQDWRCPRPGRMDPEVEKALDVTDYLMCDYVKGRGEELQYGNVYVGYHQSQVRRSGGGEADSTAIHPPKHCLPGSGWDIIDSRTVELDVPGLPERPARVNRLIIAKGNARQLVYYWYQSRGRVIAEDWKKIVNLFLDRATRNRTDGSLVRFTLPVSQRNDERAEASFYELAARIVPLLPAFVPN